MKRGALLPIDAEEPRFIERNSNVLYASEGTVVVAGSGGRVFVLEL